MKLSHPVKLGPRLIVTDRLLRWPPLGKGRHLLLAVLVTCRQRAVTSMLAGTARPLMVTCRQLLVTIRMARAARPLLSNSRQLLLTHVRQLLMTIMLV